MPRAIATFEEAKEKGKADVVSYNIIIKACAENKVFKQAKAYFEELKSSRFTLGPKSCNAYLLTLLLAGENDAADEFFKSCFNSPNNMTNSETTTKLVKIKSI